MSLTVRTDGALARQRFRLAQLGLLANIAPLDVRCMLFLISLPAAWKLLSLDFTALQQLCDGPALVAFRPLAVFSFLVENDCRVYQVVPVRALQIACAAALVLFAIFRSRVLLFMAVAMLWFIDTTAFLYRGTIFDLDTPLAILTILLFTPVNLREASTTSTTPDPRARIAMLTPFTYVATYYVLAGVAKLEFAWNWPVVVDIGNFYPLIDLWYGLELPPLVDKLARLMSDTYLAWPSIGITSATIVYIEQFLWLLAIFNLAVRVHAGIFTSAYHVIVSLTTGIVFITWFFIPLAVTFPFSAVARRFGPAAEAPCRHYPRWMSSRTALAALILVPATLAVLPSKGMPFPPFHNYYAFGWRYPSVEEFPTVYRLGWWDETGRRLRSFPIDQGGFLEYRHLTNMATYVEMTLSQTATEDSLRFAGTGLAMMINATRPSDANAWLLGQLTAPRHLLAMAGGVDMRSIKKFYMMRSANFIRQDDGRYRVAWEICGEVDRDAQPDAPAIRKYDECRATP